MSRLISKYISILLAIVMFIIGIIACNNGNEINTKDNGAKGRYVETKVELPPDFEGQYVIQMGRGDKGYPVLYTCSKDTTEKGVRKYSQSENGEWEESSVKWLEGVSITRIYDNKLIFGPNGEEYFYYGELTADGHLGFVHILKKVDENTAETIHLEGLDNLKLTDDVPLSIGVLENGDIICSYQMNHVNIYDKDTYKIISDSLSGGSNLTICGENYVEFTSEENRQQSQSISYYDSNSKLVDKIKFDKTNATKNFDLYVNKDKAVVMCNSDGIHLLNSQTKLWETIVDGSLTSLDSPSLHPTSIIEGNDRVYYCLFRNEANGIELMKYYYDKEILSKPEKELSVYSLEDNRTVRQAIIVFQRNNPNVKVNFRFSIDDNSAGNKTDYIKSLNTELLSGNGADLIIVDDLPVDCYIYKGILADISDIINPMVNSNELAQNIISCHKTGDKIYSVPLKYGVSVIYGNTQVVNSALSLDDLVNYSIKHKGEKLFGKLSYSDLMKQFLPLHVTDFYEKDNTINKEKLIKFLNKVKVIGDNSGGILQYSESEQKPDGFRSLASDSQIILSNSKGMFDAMGDISAVEYIKGSFVSYNNAFTSIGEVGINTSSKQIDLSKQFIKTLLSTEVQNEDLVDGFPINNKSLENRYNGDNGFFNILSIKNADGTTSDLNITWPKKDRRDSLMNICRKASKKTVNNDVLFNIILGQTDEFFEGKKTAEETADDIKNKYAEA